MRNATRAFDWSGTNVPTFPDGEIGKEPDLLVELVGAGERLQLAEEGVHLHGHRRTALEQCRPLLLKSGCLQIVVEEAFIDEIRVGDRTLNGVVGELLLTGVHPVPQAIGSGIRQLHLHPPLGPPWAASPGEVVERRNAVVLQRTRNLDELVPVRGRLP